MNFIKNINVNVLIMKLNEFKIGKAKEFTDEEILRFKEILLNAGEVDIDSFDKLISNNPTLLIYPSSSNIEAIGALKIPNLSYKQGVFKKTESKLNPSKFTHELGWIVSLKEGAGNGKKVTKILSELETNIYATVRVKNAAMKHILEESGFIQTGIPFKSTRGDYFIALYIKK